LPLGVECGRVDHRGRAPQLDTAASPVFRLSGASSFAFHRSPERRCRRIDGDGHHVVKARVRRPSRVEEMSAVEVREEPSSRSRDSNAREQPPPAPFDAAMIVEDRHTRLHGTPAGACLRTRSRCSLSGVQPGLDESALPGSVDREADPFIS
jgi:hypothetical protein